MADEQDNDYVQIDQENGSGDNQSDYIKQLQDQIAQLQETNKQQQFELDRYSNDKNDLGDAPTSFNKQVSHQQWTDNSGHTREVSMPGFHKQFTMNFQEEINDLHGKLNTSDHGSGASGASGARVTVNGNDIQSSGKGGSNDPNDPNIPIELKKAYLEIQQLTKQLAQFTEQARDERALIWEKPRLTIQQISTFLRKLPDKHKEKMWERHCMGEYVKIDKVGSLLFSIVALCIKIHDRNVKTPQKGTLLKKLEPYTKLIQSQIQNKDDPIGLTQEDFNDNLHEWLLLPLPIENLLSNNEREKLESELFETKKQLIEKDKEIFKERRKSKIFQESLQEIQKEAEKYEKEKQLVASKEDWERRASAALDEKDQLKLELIEKDRTIQELQGQVNELNTRANMSSRDSEDERLPDRQPNGHSVFSRYENNPFEEEKIDYSVNDNNIVKSDIYLGWKKKAEKWQQLLKEEKERSALAERNVRDKEISIEEMQQKISEYETMAEAYRNLQSDNTAWKEKVQTMTDKMNEFDREHAEMNRPARRESIAALHNTMAKGMVYAEAEHEKIVSNYEKQIYKLTSDLNYITSEFEQYKNEIDKKIENLDENVRAEEQASHLKEMNEQQRQFEILMTEHHNERDNLKMQLNDQRSELEAKEKQLNVKENEYNDLKNSVNQIKNDNNNLKKQIDQVQKNKTKCMIAAAESMNECRDVITKLNKRLLQYERR